MELITKQQALDKGLKRFFTGEPCYRGHISERFIGSEKCIACNSEVVKAYYQRNREKILARNNQYYKDKKQKNEII